MAKTILAVDDERHMLTLLRGTLENAGYKVITANSGTEALKKMASRKPDLVILDMMMPNLSGLEVCAQMRENPRTRDIKVIFLSILKPDETGMKYIRKFNISSYITKPFEIDNLLQKVKAALE